MLTLSSYSAQSMKVNVLVDAAAVISNMTTFCILDFPEIHNRMAFDNSFFVQINKKNSTNFHEHLISLKTFFFFF